LSFFLILPEIIKYFFPRHIENEGQFEYFFFQVLHTGGFIFFNLIMYVIYHMEHPFFERYKINDRPWPWNNKNEDWNGMLKTSIKQLLFNHFIILPVLTSESILTGKSHFRTDCDSFPTTFELLAQILIFMLCEDFCFYWAHRFLHWDRIYPYIHKRHHLYINTVSIASEFAHPLEFILANIITTNIAPLALGKRCHTITIIIWVILRLGETTDGHCGYEFSWSPYRLIPFSGSSEYHNFHHLNYKGNYASFFSIWDRLCGTVNKQYVEFIKKKVELSKGYDELKKKLDKEYNEKRQKLDDTYEEFDKVKDKKD